MSRIYQNAHKQARHPAVPPADPRENVPDWHREDPSVWAKRAPPASTNDIATVLAEATRTEPLIPTRRTTDIDYDPTKTPDGVLGRPEHRPALFGLHPDKVNDPHYLNTVQSVRSDTILVPRVNRQYLKRGLHTTTTKL